MRKNYEFIKVDKETSKILKEVYDYYGEQVRQPFDITYPIIMKFLTKEKYIEMLHEDLEDEIDKKRISHGY